MTKSSIEVTQDWAKTLKYAKSSKIKITTYKNGKEIKKVK
jgi:hypothetical protein